MKLKKWAPVILLGSMVALAGCSHKRPNQSAIDAANASYRHSAQASGLGRDNGLDEEGNGGSRVASNKKVYYFDFDSNSVHEADKSSVAANANYLANHPNAKVMVEGHTDPRGSREYNVGLGERRSKAIASMMTAEGVKPSQVSLVSYGAEKPASQGRAEADFQQDRRAVLVYQQNNDAS
jgi:peptidoglycan-associated lipoprotein